MINKFIATIIYFIHSFINFVYVCIITFTHWADLEMIEWNTIGKIYENS